MHVHICTVGKALLARRRLSLVLYYVLLIMFMIHNKACIVNTHFNYCDRIWYALLCFVVASPSFIKKKPQIKAGTTAGQ